MSSLVSICIPAYNAEPFIAETINSVLAQEYANVEILVSDDGSTDKTAEIVLGYRGDGVRLFRNKSNLGRYANANSAIKNTNGKYVLKLDADDLVDPNHISKQVSILEEHPEIAFAHCACRLIDGGGNLIGYERSIHGSFIRSIRDEWPRYVLGAGAVNIVMIRRSAFDLTGGYDEKYKYSGDLKMHRALIRIGSVFYNDEILASYRVHSIGKKGISYLQVKDYLMHLNDLENDWPLEVEGKEEILKKARVIYGIQSIQLAAACEIQDRKKILRIIPEFGNHIHLRLLTFFVRFGGANIINRYIVFKLSVRQSVKSFLYKNAD